MNRIVLAFVALALTTTVFAGCLGKDDLDSSVPEAIAKITPTDADDTFVFDGSASKGIGLTFAWSFGDGTESDEPKATHTYEHGTGVYTAELVITDANGLTHEWSEKVTVGSGENAPPEASFTPSARVLEVGEPITVDASATTDPDDDPVRYEWDFNFPMKLAQYHDFREAKAGGAEDDGSGNKSSVGEPLGAAIETVRDRLGKSPGDHDHGTATEPAPSMFNGQRSATDPVFTLEEGFPEETWFFIKLTAIDIKGASERIISEEIWPVEVLASKDEVFISDDRSGTFDFGAPATVTEQFPEDFPLHVEYVWPFEIKQPLMDLGRSEVGSTGSGGGSIPSMYINLTWSDGDEVPNDVQMRITTPNGDERNPTPSDGTTSLSFSGTENLGTGDWKVELWARSGIAIEYTVSYWAMVDHSPFRELEAEF